MQALLRQMLGPCATHDEQRVMRRSNEMVDKIIGSNIYKQLQKFKHWKFPGDSREYVNVSEIVAFLSGNEDWTHHIKEILNRSDMEASAEVYYIPKSILYKVVWRLPGWTFGMQTAHANSNRIANMKPLPVPPSSSFASALSAFQPTTDSLKVRAVPRSTSGPTLQTAPPPPRQQQSSKMVVTI